MEKQRLHIVQNQTKTHLIKTLMGSKFRCYLVILAPGFTAERHRLFLL